MQPLVEGRAGRELMAGDEDVLSLDPVDLRRRIGYVIQQIGLFPHKTFGANIGTVPQLLGWNKRRIAERVDELLDMVGMDPSTYGSRYPKELSGGQAQRIAKLLEEQEAGEDRQHAEHQQRTRHEPARLVRVLIDVAVARFAQEGADPEPGHVEGGQRGDEDPEDPDRLAT